MAIKNMLKAKDLESFKLFLIEKGYYEIPTSKNIYETLRLVKDSDMVIIYDQNSSKEYLSIADKDIHLVAEFYEKNREQISTNIAMIRSMPTGKLAHFLSETFCHGFGEAEILQWLNSPAKNNIT